MEKDSKLQVCQIDLFNVHNEEHFYSLLAQKVIAATSSKWEEVKHNPERCLTLPKRLPGRKGWKSSSVWMSSRTFRNLQSRTISKRNCVRTGSNISMWLTFCMAVNGTWSSLLCAATGSVGMASDKRFMHGGDCTWGACYIGRAIEFTVRNHYGGTDYPAIVLP